MFLRRATPALAALLLASGALVAAAPAASAVQPLQTSVVSAVPQAGTPQILDGIVYAVAQVDQTMVVGGSFTKVASPDPATPYARSKVVAFEADADGDPDAVSTTFLPQLDGTVQALLPGPRPGTVYVGGEFNNVDGVRGKSLLLLDLADGSRDPSFVAPTFDGTVQTLKVHDGRLYVGGTFTKVAGVPHGGLVALDADTGAVDPFVSSTVTGHHNWTPTSPSTAAKAPVGVFRLDVSPDGRRLIAIGNFTQADGLERDQMAMWDLTGTTAALADWRTTRLEPPCITTAYDSYVRDVDFSPDGSYFVLANVGGHRVDTLCDSASRWETGDTGQDVQPTWVADSGGDSVLSTAVTGEAVYVGGHQRWLNNGLAKDRAGPGAVPRPGVAALDPANGVPLAWNPGRTPRGVGASVLYATDSGLWMGSDTDYVGVDQRYRRPKIAFFPLAGGQPAASKAVPGLPGPVHLDALPPRQVTGVLHRVNAGGPVLQSIDAGPDWAADSGTTSTYRNSGSQVALRDTSIAALDSTVPSGAPRALFADERYDPGKKGDGQEMAWAFKVPAGTKVVVRVYYANRCGCTTAGKRVFDVRVDGVVKANDFDLYASVADQTGSMRRYSVTSDGRVDVQFTHEANYPSIAAIEVVKAGEGGAPAVPGQLTSRSFDGSDAGAATAVDSPFDVAAVRGATLIGSTLFYGKTDTNLYRRTLSGGTWGPETLVDPYADPEWSDKATGSGGVYRGVRPAFYNELTNLTSMSYDGKGRLYYTLYGQSGLYSRAFSPDSGVVHHDRRQVPGAVLPDVTGAFLAGGDLYYVARADGDLRRVGFSPSGLTGTPTVVSGPADDGIDWRSRVLYLGRDAEPEQSPSAAATVSCSVLRCTADGSASTDADGAVAGYRWTWGDGQSSSGATATHDYTSAGTYDVVLVVTDDDGRTATVTRQVTVQARPATPIAFRASSSVPQTTAAVLTVPVPDAVEVGDALLLKVSASGTDAAPTPPAGWSEVARQAAGTGLTVVWQRVATVQDAGAGTSFEVTLAYTTKANAQLLAYRGTAATSPVSVAVSSADAGTTTTHPTPPVQAPAGSWVVWVWADKSSATTAWTTPSAVRVRARSYGTGTGYLTAVLGDEGAARPVGQVPAQPATTDAASRAAMMTILLAPAS